MSKCLFLDRDGIINEARIIDGKPFSPRSLNETSIVCGIREVLCILSKMGYYIIVVTNQPDISRKLMSQDTSDEINNWLAYCLPIDKIYTCPHQDSDNCNCRKPKTGLFLEAQQEYGIDFSKSWMIGDRKSDIEAGKNLGCKTIFLDKHYREDKPIDVDFTIKNIEEIVEIIYGN
jgi:D-glycero-D-manno-heptose 1,7-bisphosphate phosphatase